MSSRSIVVSSLGRAARCSLVPASRNSKRGGVDPDSASALRDAAGLPFAGAELAAVDDALILVAGGAERHGAGHRSVADLAFEAVGDRARLVAPVEGEADQVGVEHAGDRPLELRRALMAGDAAAALLERAAVGARALQEIDPQLPFAGDRQGRLPLGRRLVAERGAQNRDHGIAD